VREWQQHGLPGLRCSVNLSSRQLQESDFARRVAEVLASTGLPPASLVLEITESLLMQDGPETLATLRELESTGVRIALDDFGTGFSSLGYLHRYPLHIIKIDKSFVSQAPEDERLKAISRAVIGLGRGLSMDVIAEGIETSAQMDFICSEGCHLVQGYWFSRPQSAGDLKPLLLSLSQRNNPGSPRPSALASSSALSQSSGSR
jgi:EAL domain-containing protein (putative c-di-GMP-specific phosphodiesterase class I)